ncbi:uncharacterized protein SAPINGB_P001320 [Magnusiomyces paraingens]|uniref:Uncharacterized protein n=1 Tax=Magnusiomyces paraingens TaxID=2606893 RepID=A0A5E8B549_9ASCO|nr:uncharacterized protein SAPINGB_P001320 [Saprochaete ingens]VVT46653.1 unnamed protein product [Saprochaete ingens]
MEQKQKKLQQLNTQKQLPGADVNVNVTVNDKDIDTRPPLPIVSQSRQPPLPPPQQQSLAATPLPHLPHSTRRPNFSERVLTAVFQSMAQDLERRRLRRLDPIGWHRVLVAANTALAAEGQSGGADVQLVKNMYNNNKRTYADICAAIGERPESFVFSRGRVVGRMETVEKYRHEHPGTRAFKPFPYYELFRRIAKCGRGMYSKKGEPGTEGYDEEGDEGDEGDEEEGEEGEEEGEEGEYEEGSVEDRASQQAEQQHHEQEDEDEGEEDDEEEGEGEEDTKTQLLATPRSIGSRVKSPLNRSPAVSRGSIAAINNNNNSNSNNNSNNNANNGIINNNTSNISSNNLNHNQNHNLLNTSNNSHIITATPTPLTTATTTTATINPLTTINPITASTTTTTTTATISHANKLPSRLATPVTPNVRKIQKVSLAEAICHSKSLSKNQAGNLAAHLIHRGGAADLRACFNQDMNVTQARMAEEFFALYATHLNQLATETSSPTLPSSISQQRQQSSSSSKGDGKVNEGSVANVANAAHTANTANASINPDATTTSSTTDVAINETVDTAATVETAKAATEHLWQSTEEELPATANGKADDIIDAYVARQLDQVYTGEHIEGEEGEEEDVGGIVPVEEEGEQEEVGGERGGGGGSEEAGAEAGAGAGAEAEAEAGEDEVAEEEEGEEEEEEEGHVHDQDTDADLEHKVKRRRWSPTEAAAE